MQERLIGGGVAAAIFLPLLFIGGLPFQLLVGAMAMVAVSEMLRMKHLEIFSIEGILSMVAALSWLYRLIGILSVFQQMLV